ncbi:hypothetical protein DL96DRAFT_1613714 [Flagelloscypha sp. PMI_526]|nr:hypothetical protein DL96DRAFT_1613714 [Flagelloscypha sp. PMI_526]
MGPDRTRLTSDDSVIVPRPYPRANQRGTGRVKGASSSSSAKARRRWICPDCKKVLSKKDSRHINLHRPKEEQERVFCPFKGCKQWTAKGQFCNLYPHIRRDHTHETLQCPHCPFDTHDHTCMSRHWKYKHPEMVQPSWPPPKLPPKILVSSPPVDDTASVGSPSSAFSHLQLSPFSPIYSVYGTPSPSSPASSSSSVYGTPHSPMHPLPAENAVFNASCAVYPVSINSDTADVNLPGTTTTSLYPQPVDGPLLSPLSSELSLPKLDSDSLHDNYQSSSDRSSLSDADLSLGGSPYPQPLIDNDGPLTCASESSSTSHWFLGNVNRTTFPANYGNSLDLDRRHSTLYLFLDIPATQPAPLYFGSTSSLRIWNHSSGSGNV